MKEHERIPVFYLLCKDGVARWQAYRVWQDGRG
jgi:hypothetical protein